MGLCVRLPDSRFCGLAALPYRDRRVGRSDIGAGDFCAHALASRVTRGTIIRDFLTVRDERTSPLVAIPAGIIALEQETARPRPLQKPALLERQQQRQTRGDVESRQLTRLIHSEL